MYYSFIKSIPDIILDLLQLGLHFPVLTCIFTRKWEKEMETIIHITDADLYFIYVHQTHPGI